MENPHSHAPDFAKNILDQKLHEVKQNISATEASKSVPRIYKEAIGSMKDDGLDLIKKIPNFKNIKSTLYKKRNDAVQMQKIIFNDLNEVTVPPKFIPFVLADYSHQDYRIIIFSAGDMRHLMSTLEDFLGDGTFKSCPKPFLQLYTVHADFGSQNVTTNIVPVVYALMSHKDQKSYEILFNMIKSQIPDWKPKTYKSDYEIAAMKAIKKIFPEVTVKGCFFHYNQAVWKKGAALKLTKSKLLKRQVALSAVLPLIPDSEILNGWAYIASESPNDEQSKKFRLYMIKQWIKPRDAEFRKTWCVFGERHRTTNFLEGWHHALNNAVGKKKPNINMLLVILQKDADFYRVISQQIHNQLSPTLNSRTKTNILKDEYISTCQMQFVAGEITVGHLLEKLR